jgi:hypothetical protein
LCKVLMRIHKHKVKVVARWCKNYRLRSFVICTLHLKRSTFLYLKYCHRNILQCLRFCFRVILAHLRLTHRFRTSCISQSCHKTSVDRLKEQCTKTLVRMGSQLAEVRNENITSTKWKSLLLRSLIVNVK